MRWRKIWRCSSAEERSGRQRSPGATRKCDRHRRLQCGCDWHEEKRWGNAAALDLLKNHLGANGKNVRYYAAGDKPELPDELKGLKATILGPPPKKAKAFLALMDLKKGVGQYLDSMTDGDDGPKPIQPFPTEWTADLEKDYQAKGCATTIAIDYKRVHQGRGQFAA